MRLPTEILVPAEPIEPLAKPLYPSVALRRQTTPALVGLRVTIDAKGEVVEIGPSLRAFSTPGPFAGEFQQAAEEAVKRWRFTPAEKRLLKPMRGGPGKDDYWLVIRAEKTEYTVDLTFTFATTGDVLTGTSK